MELIKLKILSREYLLNMAGSHVSSEKHSRIQILDIMETVHRSGFTSSGELLIQVLEGKIEIKVKDDLSEVSKCDQALILSGESFSVINLSESTSIVQFCWMPGPN